MVFIHATVFLTGSLKNFEILLIYMDVFNLQKFANNCTLILHYFKVKNYSPVMYFL